jgi:hypothetical protein
VGTKLLKIDAQGNELPCVLSASEQLSRVENLFLEVQDVPRGRLMYTSAANLGEMDDELSKHGFARQYCEENFGVSHSPFIRELNCLWTQRGREPLWVSGQSRPGPWGSQHTVNVARDPMHKKPPFCPVYGYPTSFRTSNAGQGALLWRLEHLRLIASGPAVGSNKTRPCGFGQM